MHFKIFVVMDEVLKMFLTGILIYAVPAWIAYMIASRHRKKYLEFMNSEASDSQKKACRLWYIISLVAVVAIVILVVYFGFNLIINAL